MADSKKAADKQSASDVIVASRAADTVARGDHTAADLEGTYRDNPDKPAEDSIAQVQDVPEDWPGVRRAVDENA